VEPCPDSTRSGPALLVASTAAEGVAAGGALDLHKGIGTPRAWEDPVRLGCARWPEDLRLLNKTTGELVRGRCRATNRCDYCARLFAVETSEMLLLDAMENAPTLYVVLTAREHLDIKACKRHLSQLRKALKKRWPGIEWAKTAEVQKRGALHLNLLVKGVPVGDRDELLDRICELWCSRVDAEAKGQFVGEVSDGPGLVRYTTLHFLKPEQAPPKGWKGHRFSCTRGYLVRPAAVMREEAKRSLRLKRLIWKGLSADAAELELEFVKGQVWALRHVRPEGQSNGGLAAELTVSACADSRPLVLGGES